MPLNKGAASMINRPDYPTTLIDAASIPEKILDKLKKQTEIILKQVWNKKDTKKTSTAKAIVSGTWLRDGLFKGWSKRRLEVDFDASDHVSLAFMEYNLFHFSNTKELAGLKKLNDLLRNKDKFEIRNFADFKELATPFLNNYNQNWLKTEYNHTVAVGQNASAFHSHWSEKDSITKFIQYQTAGDSNVRSEHAALDGLIFNIEDNEARKLYGPNGHGCRCEYVQYIGKPKKVTSGTKAISILKNNSGQKIDAFLVNRGETKRVFEANQFYIQSNVFDKDINAMTYNMFDLKKYSSMTGLKQLKFDDSITEKNVSKLLKPEKNKDYMGFSDYLKRKMILKADNFEKHTTGKYLKETENRHKMFPYIKDVLNKPDEVYLRKDKGKIQYRYIKFYKNMMFVTDTEVGTEFTVKTWYQSKVGDKIRNGLLIK